MKNKLMKFSGYMVGLGASVALPLVAFAQLQTGGNPTSCASLGTRINDIQTFICKLDEILGALLPFLIALGVVYFVWGVISYVIASDEEAKKTGRNRMIYGIIGLVVIIGVWGLVKYVTNTFGLSNGSTIVYPTVPY